MAYPRCNVERIAAGCGFSIENDELGDRAERAQRDGEHTPLSRPQFAEPDQDPDDQEGEGSGQPGRFRGHANVQPHRCYSTSVRIRLKGKRLISGDLRSCSRKS